MLCSFQLWPFSELGSWTCSKRKYYVTSDSGSEDVTLKVCNLESCVSVLHKVTICLYGVRLRVFFVVVVFVFFFAYWYRTLFLVVPNNKQAIFILDLMCNCKLWRSAFSPVVHFYAFFYNSIWVMLLINIFLVLKSYKFSRRFLSAARTCLSLK